MSDPTYTEKFVTALVSAFPTVAELQRMLSTKLGWSLERIALDGGLDDRVLAVITVARSKGAERALLNAARQANPDNPDLMAIEPLLPQAAPLVVTDDFEVCYFQRLPFIDRHDLRKAVKRLISNGGPRLLVIDGPQLSGKSYSLVFLNHLAANRGLQLVIIDLKTAFPGEVITADKIAREIALQMDLPVPPESKEEQAARRTQTFCSWLTGKLRAAPGSWWIVIDGCNDALPPDVIDLFQEMAQRIVRMWTNVRLVLVHDAPGVPLLPAATPERESIFPIDEVEITKFLMQIRRQLSLPDDDEEVGRVLSEIMRRVDPSSPERMRMIGEATAEQCRILVGD
jgi:hypothetical protein